MTYTKFRSDWAPENTLTPRECATITRQLLVNIVISYRDTLAAAVARSGVGRTPIREAAYQAHVTELRAGLARAQANLDHHDGFRIAA